MPPESNNPSVEGDGMLWAEGDMMFRVGRPGREPDQLVKVARPFALLGRAPDSDILVADRSVSNRHAYFHLDSRGVYALDLVSRSGTRIKGSDRMVGWLRPGDWVEVAGCRVELIRLRLGQITVTPPACDVDLLADNARDSLVKVTLEPSVPEEPPWVLGSELVFIGWSSSCGIQVKDPSVARAHCVLVRSPKGAYLVDLAGRQTWVEDRPVRGASVVLDGDLITIGSTRFTARIENPQSTDPGRAGVASPGGDVMLYARPMATPSVQELVPFQQPIPAIDPAQIPHDVQNALIAWMLGTIHGGQVELLRRQGEFQLAMSEVLSQIQRDNANLLNAHLARIEGIDQEISALRSEIERRNGRPAFPAPPDVAPLRIARTASPPDKARAGEQAATSWLLRRVSQLENENRSAWKDLLGRLSQPKKVT